MHLTCKDTPVQNTPITPDRNGSVKRPDKVPRSYHRHSQCRKWLNWKLALPLSTWKLKNQIAKTVQKKKWPQVVWKRHGGSWVSRCPSRENKTGCRYAELISLCITTNWQCLRWAVSVSRALPPLQIWNAITWNQDLKGEQNTGNPTG